jgi:hypothetical protein
MSERGEISITTGDHPLTSEIADAIAASAGPTGQRIATASNAASNIGQLVALRPAP